MDNPPEQGVRSGIGRPLRGRMGPRGGDQMDGGARARGRGRAGLSKTPDNTTKTKNAPGCCVS
eukprot:11192091-Lingulodinium_polyedra.AAC.1